MNRKQKKTVVAEARKLLARRFKGVPAEASCLYSAWALCAAAKEHNLHLIVQAGTAYWPRVTRAQDDGKESTHFGYQWGSELTQYIQTQTGTKAMREMHVWVVDPITKDIIDITTTHWPLQCRRLIGVEWRGTKPPSYLWCRFDKLPDGVVYEAEREACELAMKLLVEEGLQW